MRSFSNLVVGIFRETWKMHTLYMNRLLLLNEGKNILVHYHCYMLSTQGFRTWYAGGNCGPCTAESVYIIMHFAFDFSCFCYCFFAPLT